MANLLIYERGFSLSAAGEKPTAGFMVSLVGHEKQIDADTLSVFDIEQYLEEHANELTSGAFLGAWFDIEKTGLMYLDISVNVPDKETALNIGRENKQLAVFDLQTRESVYC